MTDLLDQYKFVIIGGGIAGVTCLETLSQSQCENQVLLISSSPLVKVVTNFQHITDTLHSFDVKETPLDCLQKSPNATVIHDTVLGLDTLKQEIKTERNGSIRFERLCICTGARPKVFCEKNEYVVGIRDTESIQDFQKKLSTARRIVVVGNGGIATELVHEVDNCEIIWAIKDDSIVSAFVDCGAGQFFLQQLARKKSHSAEPSKRLKYTTRGGTHPTTHHTTGSALGPDWLTDLELHGLHKTLANTVHVEYKVEVSRVWSHDDLITTNRTIHEPFSPTDSTDKLDQWPVYVELNNNKTYGCDLIVSATGVIPNSLPFTEQLTTCPDGGIEINNRMTTNCACVYAAGDVATATWDIAPHWLQMRLWTQARQHGCYAAKCMIADDAGEAIHMDICFDLFAHVTKFFGFKVILLGRFNAQGLGDDHSLLLRVTEGVEYIKVILQNGRMQGAILIGETDLEETFENLILNGTDLSRYGTELLDPNIDIADFFD